MSKIENSNKLHLHIAYLLEKPSYLIDILSSKNKTYFGVLLNFILRTFVKEFDPNKNHNDAYIVNLVSGISFFSFLKILKDVILTKIFKRKDNLWYHVMSLVDIFMHNHDNKENYEKFYTDLLDQNFLQYLRDKTLPTNISNVQKIIESYLIFSIDRKIPIQELRNIVNFLNHALNIFSKNIDSFETLLEMLDKDNLNPKNALKLKMQLIEESLPILAFFRNTLTNENTIDIIFNFKIVRDLFYINNDRNINKQRFTETKKLVKKHANTINNILGLLTPAAITLEKYLKVSDNFDISYANVFEEGTRHNESHSTIETKFNILRIVQEILQEIDFESILSQELVKDFSSLLILFKNNESQKISQLYTQFKDQYISYQFWTSLPEQLETKLGASDDFSAIRYHLHNLIQLKDREKKLYYKALRAGESQDKEKNIQTHLNKMDELHSKIEFITYIYRRIFLYNKLQPLLVEVFQEIENNYGQFIEILNNLQNLLVKNLKDIKTKKQFENIFYGPLTPEKQILIGNSDRNRFIFPLIGDILSFNNIQNLKLFTHTAESISMLYFYIVPNSFNSYLAASRSSHNYFDSQVCNNSHHPDFIQYVNNRVNELVIIFNSGAQGYIAILTKKFLDLGLNPFASGPQYQLKNTTRAIGIESYDQFMRIISNDIPTGTVASYRDLRDVLGKINEGFYIKHNESNGFLTFARLFRSHKINQVINSPNFKDNFNKLLANIFGVKQASLFPALQNLLNKIYNYQNNELYIADNFLYLYKLLEELANFSQTLKENYLSANNTKLAPHVDSIVYEILKRKVHFYKQNITYSISLANQPTLSITLYDFRRACETYNDDHHKFFSSEKASVKKVKFLNFTNGIFSDCDFSNLYLGHANFHGAKFYGKTNFENADLRYCNFMDIHFTKAIVNMNRAIFSSNEQAQKFVEAIINSNNIVGKAIKQLGIIPQNNITLKTQYVLIIPIDTDQASILTIKEILNNIDPEKLGEKLKEFEQVNKDAQQSFLHKRRASSPLLLM